MASGLLAAGLLLGASGCHRFSHSAAAPTGCELRLTLDKPIYQPGEAVLASVELTDPAGKPRPVRDLNAQSVQFFFGRQDQPERMERSAVASSREPLARLAELTPDRPLSRTFILTRLTQFGGPLVAQAHYSAGPTTGTAEHDSLPPKIYSNVVKYEVKGHLLFTRDPDGVIEKKDAIRIAQTAAPGAPGAPVKAAEAILIEDEAGFLEWWVNLTLTEGGGEQVRSWFVDPYAGRVRHEAKAPFDPALAHDPRFDRPANAPRQPVNINTLLKQDVPAPSAKPAGPAAPAAPAAPPR